MSHAEYEIKKGSQQSKKEKMPWGLLFIYIDVVYVSIFIYVAVSVIDVVCVVVSIFAVVYVVVYIDVSIVIAIAHSKLKSFFVREIICCISLLNKKKNLCQRRKIESHEDDEDDRFSFVDLMDKVSDRYLSNPDL